MSKAQATAQASSGGGCGCITFIATVFVIWAVCFGVTYEGKHYGLSCSTEHGVSVDTGAQ